MSNYDPLDLRGQDRSKAERELRDRLARENEKADIKWLMGFKRGRRMLWRLLDQAGVFRSSFNTNAIAMSFAEGNRSYGLRIIDIIHEQCSELYPTMIKENSSHERNNDDGSRDNQ